MNARAAPAPSLLARLRRNPVALAALATLALVALLALLAPTLAPYSPRSQLDVLALSSRPPSLAHPLGTDQYSRDVLSRVLHGGRISLGVACVAALVAATIGTAVGALAGYAGGSLDSVLMRLVDAGLAVPRVVVLLAVFAMWPTLPLGALVLLLGATAWFPLSRMVRGQVLAARGREYVLAARALGAGEIRLLVRHVLPNVLSAVVVASTLVVGDVIVLEAGLSFLGVGVQAPTASWGNIVQDGAELLPGAWWIALFPGLAIAVTVMAVNVLGDALRDTLDPRQLPHP